jgi:hypothetical protein
VRTSRTARSSTRIAIRVVPVSVALAALLVRPANAELCAARVELEGEASVVGQVTAELARLGVERGKPSPGCRGVLAQVESDREGGIAVAIRDGARRSEGRVVSDPAIAASWIDSWLHDDLDGRAWLISAPVQVAAIQPAIVAKPVAAPHTGMLERGSIAVGYEQVWLDDGASASGIGATACFAINGACIGVRGSYTREGERTVDLTAMARSDLQLLAIARLPLSAGKMTIAPELGLGFGRMATRRVEGCVPSNTMPGDPNCDPMDPTCMPEPPPSCMDPAGKVYVGDNFATATWTPRLTAGVRIAVPLFERVWLDGIAGYTLAPFGHSGSYAGKDLVNPDGTITPNAGELALPGEPGGGFQLGIGLRLGAAR